MQLRSLAAACVRGFEERIDDFQGGDSETLAAKHQLMQEQSARFNLWADNNGLFAEGNASLDARIREQPDIIDLVIGQLSLLQRHLARFGHSVSSKDEAVEIQAATDIQDDVSTASAPSASSWSSVTDEDASEDEVAPENDGNDDNQPSPLACIIQAVHRLHRVGIAIRRAGASSHDLKASKEQFTDEHGTNVVDVFRDYCLYLLRHTFKTADLRLLERLAQANGERRRIFLYRKQHEMKLKGRRDMTPGNKTSTVQHLRPFSASRMSSLADLDSFRDHAMEKGSVALESQARMSQTTASGFNREGWRYEPSILSTVFTAAPSTTRLVDSSIWPPAPKVPAGAAEFVCPYCCKIQPAAERGGKRWRAHFLRDLSPYVCLVESCDDPYHLFHDFSSWRDHMEKHNAKYTCRQHPKPKHFDSGADFDRHILQEHQHLPQAQLVRLRSINDSRSRLDICSCPLCGFAPTKAPQPGKSVASHEAAYKELLGHMAHCLHSVAMWSLDEIEDMNESIPSNPSEFRVAEESTLATENESFDLDIADGSFDWNLGVAEELSTPAGTEVDTLDCTPADSNASEEWSFVLKRWNSPDDAPHHDAKLESFVRKYQLEKLLEEGKAADPHLPYCQAAPDPGEDFYGRQDALLALENNLHPARAAKELRTFTLTGPAGIGKTALAARYCHQYQNQYDVVIWVHADQDSKIATDFCRIAIGLGFVAKDSIESRDHDHCRQLVKAWLANPLKQRERPGDSEKASWLLVLDHIIDSNAANDYWPSNCRSGSILITSRKPMPWRSTHYPVLEVMPFNSEESAAFLFSQIQSQDLDGQSIRLGARALYTPMQLTFLAKTIKSKKYSLEKFLQASQDDSGKKTILLLHTEDATKNQADFADWALESLSPGASALLSVISMLDPDEISEDILMNPPDIVSIPNYPQTAEDYARARAELLGFTFISRNRATRSLSIHRVVQDAARRNMSAQQFRVAFNAVVALLVDEWPFAEFTWRHSTDRWDVCDMLYLHIRRIMGFAKRVNAVEEEIDADYGYAKLATDVSWFCHERGRSSVGVEFCQTALGVCLALKTFLASNANLSKVVNLSQIEATIAEIHHNHGCIIAEMNEPQQALEHQLIFNQMMLKELGDQPGTDMRLALSFNELGVAYMINDDVAKGKKCFQRAADEMRRLDDFEEWRISLPMVNLGYCLYFEEQYADAEAILRQGLADRTAKFGENDRESFITGRFYNGLALVKRAQGLEDGSYVYLKRAQDHYRSTVGRGHHRSADIAVAIGCHHYRNAEYTNAVDFLNVALQTYGDRSIYNPEKARSLFFRSKAYRQLGNLNAALDDELACMTLFRKINVGDARSLDQLTSDDFDRRIVFWSR